jgi:hypothetical protein
MKPYEEGAVWNPEQADREAKIRSLRLFAVILLIAALGAVWIYTVSEQKKRTGEVDLSASLSFEEADQKLRSAGFTPLDEGYTHGSETLQTYYGRRVFGVMPVYSALESGLRENETYLRLSHIFEEDQLSSPSRPGEIFQELMKNLTKLYGAPQEISAADGPYWQWTRRDRSLVQLGYLTLSSPMLCYTWAERGGRS